MNPGAVSEATISLAQRLAVVQDTLCVDGPRATDANTSPLDVLLSLVDQVRERRRLDEAWLLIVGVTGAMPDQVLVRSVARALDLRESDDSVRWLLDALAPLAMQGGNAGTTLRVVQDRPLVDVSLTAKNDLLTGIQRVVRGVVNAWNDVHDIELVVATTRGGAYRNLYATERARLLDRDPDDSDTNDSSAAGELREIVVPWQVPLVLTEVPTKVLSERLAAVAEMTDTSVRLIGYDCIPMSSPETVPLAEPEKFGHYLELVKFSDRLAAISGSAAAEFEGFVRSLAAQGLSGPNVAACPLPHTLPVVGAAIDVPAPDRPVAVCVGTVGRRKNQSALVEAAEMLWREGHEFELRVLGHLSSEHSPLVGLIPELQNLGRPLVLEAAVSDTRIASTLMHARCLVFPSLHEGFGLPIVEALSHGVPVITSDFGSTREVADGKGCLLVNPEDVKELTDALRRLLTDASLHARLVAEALARPRRTWTEYADELYAVLLA